MNERLGDLLAAFDAIGGNAQRKSSDGSDRGLARRAICHHSWHRLDVGPPATVFFVSDYDRNGFDCDCLHPSPLHRIVRDSSDRSDFDLLGDTGGLGNRFTKLA